MIQFQGIFLTKIFPENFGPQAATNRNLQGLVEPYKNHTWREQLEKHQPDGVSDQGIGIYATKKI